MADAGSRDAQVDFYMEGPGGKPVDLEARADDLEVQQWKQQAISYLRQAGAQCDQFAPACCPTPMTPARSWRATRAAR
jgi:hypothetical protein